MKRRTVALSLAALAVLTLGAVAAYWLQREKPPAPFSPSLERGVVVPVADYRLSGPYTHDNLTVFLVHGPETLDGKSFLPLQEALELHKATVYETEEVNELTIENRSDEEVYVQAGDIVKGGKQDRTFPYDSLIEPNSGPVAINSYCVEQGRWARRGEEPAAYFKSSANNVGSVHGITFVGGGGGRSAQADVWRGVGMTQDKLSKKLGDSVKAEESMSSLQLTLESTAVRKAIEPYLKTLGSTPDGRSDVIGYVAVVNGQVLSADVYASRSLFRKLWPKLLESSAVEAFIEAAPDRKFDAAHEDAVRAFLTHAEGGEGHSEAVTERTYVLVRKAGQTMLFESCDRSRNNLVLHRSFLGNPEGESNP